MSTTTRRSWPIEITTSRLVMRPLRDDDREALIRLVTDPAARDYLGGSIAFASPQALELSPLGLTWGQWAIASGSTDEMLGSVSLTDDRGELQVAFALLPERQGRGYAREAVAGVLAWAARQHLAHEVIAVAPSRSKGSVDLLQRLGFTTRRGFEEFGAPHLLMACPLDEERILAAMPDAAPASAVYARSSTDHCEESS